PRTMESQRDGKNLSQNATGTAGAPGPMQADLLASLAAIGRSMQEQFDPRRFLGQFSAQIQGLIPHDRLVMDHLDEDGRTFTVFAEHAPRGPVLHRAYYTTAFDPQGRYVVAEWAIRSVFAGEAMRVDDLRTDPRFSTPNPFEHKLQEAGLRSALVVPLRSGGRIIGALATTSLTPTIYTDVHLAAARQVADLIGPFIESVILLQQERRRRQRLRALESLLSTLGASLNVQDVFNRLAEAVRPILEFDVMGVCLVSTSGRELEMLAEVTDIPVEGRPPRIPLEDFSFSSRVVAGESVLIHNAQFELVPEFPGDHRIMEGGGHSLMIVPLRFGEQVGGGLYFGKRQPNWYDRRDMEIATGIAAHVVLAVQHQRLAEEQRRLALAEVRAQKLERRVATLREALDERYGFDRIVGRAPSLKEALKLSAKVATTETTVLLTGESGTGKELVARAVHYASLRADGPFVTLNCAALPETLLESELFGHEKGAFTGADKQKPGRFELAAGGTLFLDEVGELSHPVQAKLLRVLQDGEFVRVGGTVTLHANVRIIAATNRNLEGAVDAGQFREDLYYRLNVFRIHLPPLRERGDDVLLLAEHFVRDLGPDMGKSEMGLSRDARDALLAHPWPGNIRELQNAIERALIMSEGGLLTASQLGIVSRRENPAPVPQAPATAGAPESPSSQSLPDWEKHLVLDVLKKTKGNKSEAAKILGITRSQLYTRLKRFGIDA
ncbi:MAG TPA: sigma 54-interacting transcriptional regulator, partial [Candidatus Methylomirabilis sp.]|nr:sigma 54-interacting transcriptional regulator [Candidatus Methylomirabilis sp.]